MSKLNPTLSNFFNISKHYGSSPFTISAPTSNSTGAFTYTISNSSVATISLTTVKIVGVGQTTITAIQSETGSYNSASITADLVVYEKDIYIASNSILNKPYDLAFDSSNNLYCANYGNNTITKITPDSSITTFASENLNGSQGLVFDISGNLYCTNYFGSNITKITQNGTATVFATNLGYPRDLIFDISGNLYCTNEFGNNIFKITYNGSISVFVNNLNRPIGLTIDTSGNIYSTNIGNNTINKITPTGNIEIFANSGLSFPHYIAFDKHGNLFCTNWGNNTISKIKSNGSVSRFIDSASELNEPVGLTFDLDENLVCSNFGNNSILKFNINKKTQLLTNFNNITKKITDTSFSIISPKIDSYSTISFYKLSLEKGFNYTYFDDSLISSSSIISKGNGVEIFGFNEQEFLVVSPSSTILNANMNTAITNNWYFQITITPKTMIKLNKITLEWARGGSNGVRGWFVRSSIDNYNSNIYQNETPNGTPIRFNVELINLLGFENINIATTFRFYFYTDSSFRYMYFKNITFYGSNHLFIYTSSNTSVATINGTTVNILGIGNTTITARVDETPIYKGANIKATLTVTKSNPSISNFNNIIKRFGDPPFSLTQPTSNSNGAFTYISSNTAVATISGNTVTIVGPGETTITATQAETDYYLIGTITSILIVEKTDAKILKASGYTANQLKQAGYTVNELKEADYTINDLKEAGYTVNELKQAGYTANELKQIGYSLKDLVVGTNYTISELKDAGYIFRHGISNRGRNNLL